MGGVLLESMYLPLDQPLRLWLGGAIALGFPVSLLVSRVAKRCGFRQAFIVESMATIASGGTAIPVVFGRFIRFFLRRSYVVGK